MHTHTHYKYTLPQNTITTLLYIATILLKLQKIYFVMFPGNWNTLCIEAVVDIRVFAIFECKIAFRNVFLCCNRCQSPVVSPVANHIIKKFWCLGVMTYIAAMLLKRITRKKIRKLTVWWLPYPANIEPINRSLQGLLIDCFASHRIPQRKHPRKPFQENSNQFCCQRRNGNLHAHPSLFYTWKYSMLLTL